MGDEYVGNMKGAFQDNSVKDLKEAFDFVGPVPEEDDGSPFPEEVPGFKDVVDKYRGSLIPLIRKIFYALATYLELDDPEFFIKLHRSIFEDPSIQAHNFIRSNYYFPVNPLETAGNRDGLRLAEHCDQDSITLVVQDDTGGLEVKFESGDWIPVTPIPGSIVVNIGFAMELWTGGNLPANPHRVRVVQDQPIGVRQSAAMFVHPDGFVKCRPLIPKNKDWKARFPHHDDQIHFEYFTNIIRQIRSTE